MTAGLVRRLSFGLAAAYAASGTLEVILKVADDAAAATILFFGGTLLGGAGLIFCGLFAHVSSTTRRVCVMLGAEAGLLASARTLLVPVLAVSVIIAMVSEAGGGLHQRLALVRRWKGISRHHSNFNR